MAEGRMANIVDQSQSLDQIGVEAEGCGNGAADLRDFESMREAIAKMIGEARGEDLRFGFEAAEGARMNDAIAVACIVVAIGMRGFGAAPAAGEPNVHGIGREQKRRPGRY